MASSSDAALPSSFEELFLIMHYRKMQRDLNGPQKKKSKYHFVALACLLVLVYGLSVAGSDSGNTDANQPVTVALTLNQIILIGVWVFVAVVITAIFAGTKFILVLYWMVVYWPLLAILATMLLGLSTNDEQLVGEIIGYLLLVAEVGTLLSYIAVFYVYPRFVTSEWFRENHARRFWRIELLDDGMTMQYDGPWGRCGKRYQCHYKGQINEKGLPHGYGVWSDNHYDGEVLTGMWEDGHPIAPYSSRQYGGRGSTFSAVRLAYFMATDDTFEANKMMPTNENPPRCGLASVECSVAGDFMSHLPNATLLGEPQTEGEEVNIGQICRQLDCDPQTTAEEGEQRKATTLQINANDPRGVQIDGYVYAPTGLPFTKRMKQIVVDVRGLNGEPEYGAIEVNTNGDDANGSEHSMLGPNFSLEVMNWTKTTAKDALIFLPGFNSWLKHSLETFGQLCAMTSLSEKVYPILFSWPGAQVLTYRQASLISASENNRRYFLQMLKSLKAEGFVNIHIITHSLGVQTLMNCFEDVDGSPSPVSQMFGPAPSTTDGSSSLADIGKLVCRSITMLNPDYALDAFREHGFRSLRRVASLITIVGDKTDQALFWSSLINGIVNRCGWMQPSALDSEARRNLKGFHLQAPIGRSIDSLYVKKGEAILAEQVSEWLDCDAIDTTGLDTNVNDLRHSAYTVNSILLRDIEEIVMTGKRAAHRTTLLHREGNVFEYCHAPSFVKQ